MKSLHYQGNSSAICSKPGSSRARRSKIIIRKILSDKKKRSYIVSSIALISIVVGCAVFWHKTLYHFKTVVPGRVYRSGTMSDTGLKIAHQMYGIKTIINLRSEGEMKRDWYTREKKFAELNHITLVDIPMLPDTPPAEAQIEHFLRIVNDTDMLPVLIHCQAGIIRTGMMVAVYRIGVLKEPNAKVMADLPWFGRTFENRPAVKDFILGYNPHAGRSPKDASLSFRIKPASGEKSSE